MIRGKEPQVTLLDSSAKILGTLVKVVVRDLERPVSCECFGWPKN